MRDNDAPQLDFSRDPSLSGFRLEKLEVFNWGTFDKTVWTLQLGGRNSLLTGDIGSGKSTLVDAVTTLLVPAHRVAYNKAAGADLKERTLRSYVLGFYKSERGELNHTARPVALRDLNTYSVILGVFRNRGFHQSVTLAQVFWLKDPHSQPARLYVVAPEELNIQQDFANFGSDISNLKRRLKAKGLSCSETFNEYGAHFRRRFGIENEQALELFHQTVSMKSVGNLTDFVRGHMLEPFEVEPRISSLIQHFDDLSRAHESVRRAREQVEQLTPLVADCDRHRDLSAEVETLKVCRSALHTWFGQQKAIHLRSRLDKHTREQQHTEIRLAQKENEKKVAMEEIQELTRAIAENGGERLTRLGEEIQRQQKEKSGRLTRAERHDLQVKTLCLPVPHTSDVFLENRARCDGLKVENQRQQDEVQHHRTERHVDFRKLREEHEVLEAELRGLRARRTNIDQAQVAIRQTLCGALGLSEVELPYAGELIQVRQSERAWEGTAERLLRNFGLSLLVPDRYYAQVADWVEQTHLRGRLVYYRLRSGPVAELPTLHPQSLVKKLEVKPDHPACDWLELEMARRFDVACCDTLEQFRREPRAVTRSGQIKSQGDRHEKDDRHRLEDRSRYVLGWSNEAKIATLDRQKMAKEEQIARIGQEISGLEGSLKNLKQQEQGIIQVLEVRDFSEIDWRSVALEISQLEDKVREIEAASDGLKALGRQLEETRRRLHVLEKDAKTLQSEVGVLTERLAGVARSLAECEALSNEPRAEEFARHFDHLEKLRVEAKVEIATTMESCDPRERELREWLTEKKIKAQEEKLRKLVEKILRKMGEFCAAFPVESQEFNPSLESADACRQMLGQLNGDDLPRFEARFKELLNQNTIREVANFQSQLHRERETIRDRIDHINTSLHQIDYNPARYIRLEAEPAVDVEIREFTGELRVCTEGTLSGSDDDQYSEAKFLQVKKIIERLRGREGQADQDRRWARKVTDVRNWFTFSASERWREDDIEHEHYTDSGGKSGGQKEKLAYTILAASLAYQFGLEWGEVSSRTFRFVVIDEAFGRGSDESARFGLELFKRLGLQLLIVTPLQKLHIIEPYVSTVGFVHNMDGRSSRLRNLTIEAYRAEKEARSVVTMDHP